MTIDTAKMQRAASAKQYQAVADSGTHEAKTMLMDIAPILSNPVQYLDRLVCIAPSAEYFAQSAIMASLGYAVINQHLFAYRKAHAKAKTELPDIDWFNGQYADSFEDRIDAEMSADNGHAKLPDFDAIPFTGIYMQLFRDQRGNSQYSAKYPPRAPNEIIHEMQTNDRGNEIRKAARELDEALIAASPARRAIMAELNKTKRALDDYQVRQHKAEMAYMVPLLQNVMPGRLTDAMWATIPLFIQYKLTYFVYNQATKAAANESSQRAREGDKFEELLEMVDAIHLELEAAARTAEVRLAFESNRIDEKYALPSKDDAEIEVKPQVTMARAAFIAPSATKAEVTAAVEEAVVEHISGADRTLASLIALQPPRATLSLKH